MPTEELISLFRDIKAIGEYEDPEEIAAKLEQMKDPEIFGAVRVDITLESSAKGIFEFINSIQNQPWMHANHQVGYIALRKSDFNQPQIIQYAGAVEPDRTLKNSRINIRLDRLHIEKYPGGGTHNVLVTFAARNQVAQTQESVSFSQTYRVKEGQSAGIAGYPIFIGLNVGSELLLNARR